MACYCMLASILEYHRQSTNVQITIHHRHATSIKPRPPTITSNRTTPQTSQHTKKQQQVLACSNRLTCCWHQMIQSIYSRSSINMPLQTAFHPHAQHAYRGVRRTDSRQCHSCLQRLSTTIHNRTEQSHQTWRHFNMLCVFNWYN
jgi:hypothetical protein